MIILMQTLYSTIHVGDKVYYDVSETTWQCYCRLIRWLQDEEAIVSQAFQGGWGIKVSD